MARLGVKKLLRQLGEELERRPAERAEKRAELPQPEPPWPMPGPVPVREEAGGALRTVRVKSASPGEAGAPREGAALGKVFEAKLSGVLQADAEAKKKREAGEGKPLVLEFPKVSESVIATTVPLTEREVGLVHGLPTPMYSIPKEMMGVKIPSEWEPVSPATINVKYPLVEPYSYAFISWDEKNQALSYVVMEPPLSHSEAAKLDLIKELVIDLLDINLMAVRETATIQKYLQEKLNEIIIDRGVDVTKSEYDKILYYVNRNFLGLGPIEPLMQDPQIEDVSCDGVGVNLFVYHRKFGSMRTNLVFSDADELNKFVTKLSQRCGKHISVAEPLMDGALPDGSRVQATFSAGKDIATRGSTFTIRKFTKDPLTIVDFMGFGTIPAIMGAYFWLALEFRNSILVSGGTASGKCIAPNQLIYSANGEVDEIKNVFEGKVGKIPNPPVDAAIPEEKAAKMDVLSLDTETLQLKNRRVSMFWRLAPTKEMVRVKSNTGSEVLVTPEHPFFTIEEGEIKKIRADLLSKGDYIAVPRLLPIRGSAAQKIELCDYFKPADRIYACIENKKELFANLREKYGTYNDAAEHFSVNKRRFGEWTQKNAIPLGYLKLLMDSGFEVKIGKIKSKTSDKELKLLQKISPELLRFVGYVLADGTMRTYAVKFFNKDRRLLRDFLACGKKLFGIQGKIMKQRTTFCAEIGSSAIPFILNRVFEIPYGRKARIIKIPKIIQRSSNRELAHFIRALFDCEAYVSVRGRQVEFSTASKDFAERLAALLLRFKIITTLREKEVKGTKYYRLNICGYENFSNFRKISFLHKRKREVFEKMLKTGKKDTNMDIVPGLGKIFWQLLLKSGLTRKKLSEVCGISRRAISFYISEERKPSRSMLKKIVGRLKKTGFGEERSFLEKIADSHLFWAKIEDVERIENRFEHVYDFTVPVAHNFVAGSIPVLVSNTSCLNVLCLFLPPEVKIVSIEDTPELALPHEHWIAKVARTGYGPEVGERRRGEITMFDLLKAALRERPEELVVGEVRGKEAYVLFQGMATGHAGLATIHGESLDAIVSRLTTPPISLSPGLLQHLNIVVVMANIRMKGHEVRRIREVVEIIGVDPKTEKPIVNTIFKWIPTGDYYEFASDRSYIFNKIVEAKGVDEKSVWEELHRRAEILTWLKKQGIRFYKDVGAMIALYYKNPDEALKRVYGS